MSPAKLVSMAPVASRMPVATMAPVPYGCRAVPEHADAIDPHRCAGFAGRVAGGVGRIRPALPSSATGGSTETTTSTAGPGSRSSMPMAAGAIEPLVLIVAGLYWLAPYVLQPTKVDYTGFVLLAALGVTFGIAALILLRGSGEL